MPTQASSRRTIPRPAFTLIEALVSTAIATIAGTALLLGISSTIQITDAVLEETLAEGLAQQLMDEIAGCRFVEPGASPQSTYFGPDAGESNGQRRDAFDDIDDFQGLAASPPRDLWGVALGSDDGGGGQRHAGFRAPDGTFDGWRQQVEVFFASDSDLLTPLAVGQTSSHKVVRVRIVRVDANLASRTLAETTRVFHYIPN
jgi:type II secretory pathway pseudopilin PulG